MLRHIKKIINTIINVLLVATIIMTVFFGYSTLQIKIKKREYPNVFGYTFFKVITGSMVNTINIDDVVIVKIKDKETEFMKDDIIVFKQGSNMITHRIFEIGEEKFITKGDANNTLDEPITRNEIIGKVVKIIPKVGIWQKVIMSPQVFLSIIITIILFGLAFSNEDSKTRAVINKKKEDKNND